MEHQWRSLFAKKVHSRQRIYIYIEFWTSNLLFRRTACWTFATWFTTLPRAHWGQVNFSPRRWFGHFWWFLCQALWNTLSLMSLHADKKRIKLMGVTDTTSQSEVVRHVKVWSGPRWGLHWSCSELITIVVDVLWKFKIKVFSRFSINLYIKGSDLRYFGFRALW